MSLWDTFKRFVDRDQQHVIRLNIDPTHAAHQLEPVGVDANRHYIRLRLAEMFLSHRTAWLNNWHPAVHSIVRLDFGNQSVEIPSVVDASRVGMLTNSAGDAIAKNFVLTPTIPFNGGLIALNAGFIALEGERDLNSLLKVLGNFASLLSVTKLSTALNVVQPLASGIHELFRAGTIRTPLAFYHMYVPGEVKAENPIQVQEIWGYRFAIE